MDLRILQKKYPKFVYKGYSWKHENGALAVLFDFEIEPDLKFSPQIVIANVSKLSLEKLGKNKIDNLAFNLGMAEILTYWKATCAKEILVDCGYLDAAQIRFWRGLFFNGMGQFFYENKLDPFAPLLKIGSSRPKIHPNPVNAKFSPEYLVPVGGGKDALVTYEAVKMAKKKAAIFILNENRILKNLAARLKAEKITVVRKVDPRLFAQNRAGFLNGHTPFSSILAVLSVSLAVLFDKKYVAISQERSSGEGNVEYRGRKINHQYSKSYEFERKFRTYSKVYLAKNVEFFSSLRPFYEIQIAKIFSGLPQYFPYFLSCNKPYRITDSSIASWCRKCPKCLFTYAALYPFCKKEQMAKIFGADLFNDKSLIPLMEELVGDIKPFECVGTRSETVAAFYLSLKKEEGAAGLPPVLEYFKKHILPANPRINRTSGLILASWDKRNFVPKVIERSLRKLMAQRLP